MKCNKKYCLYFVFATICELSQAAVVTSGHLKAQNNFLSFPSDSVFYLLQGSNTQTQQAEFRFNLSAGFQEYSAWEFKLDYQLIAIDDQLSTQNNVLSSSTLNDDRRLFNFTDTLNDGELQVMQRLDRFNLAYTGEKFVARLGRQALSWGSGLMFSVMDIVNPFDGRVYDREYKVGDDLLYMQYLLNDGSDIQFASVFRRDIQSGKLESTQSTNAGKYHGFYRNLELDFLVAKHYDEDIFALGLSSAIGGAIAYSEIAQTNLREGVSTSGLFGINYSWLWFEHNFSGILEFYHNDMGIKGDIAYADILNNAPLFDRILRGEIQLFGRNYLAASSTMEVSPLFLSSANFFYNLQDESALFQLTAQYDWQQNTQLFFALALPLGEKGGELSGLESEIPSFYWVNNFQLQAKLAWYY